MQFKFLLAILFVVGIASFSIAQIDGDRAEALGASNLPDSGRTWKIGAGVGLDFSQLLLLNPKVGAGENQIGFGGVATVFANHKKDRWLWMNKGSALFAVRKIGSGKSTVSTDPNKNQPFQKAVDELRIFSNLAYEMTENSKWYYSLEFLFLTQLTATYPGNYLTQQDSLGANSKFLSPAQLSLSPGVKFVPNDNFSLNISPAALRMIIVADNTIASVPGLPDSGYGLHGNPWRSSTDFDNVDVRLGASLTANYNNSFVKDKMKFTSELNLYTNYLENPFSVTAVDWRNELAFEIVKGLSLNLAVNLFYDHNIPVQISNNDFVGGVERDPNGAPILARRLSVTQFLLIKYDHIF